MEKELTLREAIRALGITIDAGYKLIWSGKLDAQKIDGKWLISEESLHQRLQVRRLADGTPDSRN